nr:MAG: wsv447-like protein [Metapenaeus ensis nimavirus]
MACCATPPEYELRLSEEILWCGQVAPMQRVQFCLHARRNKSFEAVRRRAGNSLSGLLFSSHFRKNLLRGVVFQEAKVLMATEMLGHVFAGQSTSSVRASLFHGVGRVIACGRISMEKHNKNDVLNGIEEFIICQLRQFQANGGLRACFFVTAVYSDSGCRGAK